nr:MAG TPA: Head protein [Podoviridae sp. ctHVs9]
MGNTTSKATRAVNMANAVRTLAGDDFANAVPVATRTNISSYATPILEISSLRNMFVNTLVQRIGFEFIHNKRYSNPLARFKKGSTPLGGIVEEIGTNPVESQGFSSDGYIRTPDGQVLTPLNRRTPDTKVLYHTINREDQYPISISRQQLQTAFVSWEKLDDFISSVMSAMYSGDTIDEFIYTKNLIDAGVTKDMLVTRTIANPTTSKENAENFVREMNIVSSKMCFPSTKYNKYIDQEGAEGKAYKTWSDKERQVIILSTEVLQTINISVLSQAFHMSQADFRNAVVEIDEFDNPAILGVVCDESLLQIYDNLFEVSEQQNAQGLFFTYFLTHFETLSLSMLSNAVVFLDESYVKHTIAATVDPVTEGYGLEVQNSGYNGETVTYKVTAVDPSKVTISYTGLEGEPPKTVINGGLYSFTMGNEDATIKMTIAE